MALEVYLVRHGKTVFNTVGRLQGWSDSPLTPEGREVASCLGKALKDKVHFDAAFCSVSPRAHDTAKLILQAKEQADLPLQVVEEIREYCFGGLEGELTQVVQQKIADHRGYASVEEWLEAYRHGSYHMLAESVSELDPLGLAETEEQFMQRLQKGMAYIAQNAPHDGVILVVAHGMSITGILKNIEPQSTLYKSVGNATVTRLEYENDKWKICFIGESYTEIN